MKLFEEKTIDLKMKTIDYYYDFLHWIFDFHYHREEPLVLQLVYVEFVLVLEEFPSEMKVFLVIENE